MSNFDMLLDEMHPCCMKEIENEKRKKEINNVKIVLKKLCYFFKTIINVILWGKYRNYDYMTEVITA